VPGIEPGGDGREPGMLAVDPREELAPDELED
jgi:hypothetical protein